MLNLQKCYTFSVLGQQIPISNIKYKKQMCFKLVHKCHLCGLLLAVKFITTIKCFIKEVAGLARAGKECIS